MKNELSSSSFRSLFFYERRGKKEGRQWKFPKGNCPTTTHQRKSHSLTPRKALRSERVWQQKGERKRNQIANLKCNFPDTKFRPLLLFHLLDLGERRTKAFYTHTMMFSSLASSSCVCMVDVVSDHVCNRYKGRTRRSKKMINKCNQMLSG